MKDRDTCSVGKYGIISPGFDALYHTVGAIAISRYSEDKMYNSSEDSPKSTTTFE